jgi:hypothetical protein
MALIQFPEGLGPVGESVFQRLREFRRLHELSWGDEILFDETGRTRTKRERGAALNNQKANTIADMAAVLGGAGSGNKMWVEVKDAAPNEDYNAPAKGETVANEATKREKLLDPDGLRELAEVMVYWADEQLQNYAERWTPNVIHDVLEPEVVEEVDDVITAEALPEQKEAQPTPAS